MNNFKANIGKPRYINQSPYQRPHNASAGGRYSTWGRDASPMISENWNDMETLPTATMRPMWQPTLSDDSQYNMRGVMSPGPAHYSAMVDCNMMPSRQSPAVHNPYGMMASSPPVMPLYPHANSSYLGSESMGIPATQDMFLGSLFDDVSSSTMNEGYLQEESHYPRYPAMEASTGSIARAPGSNLQRYTKTDITTGVAKISVNIPRANANFKEGKHVRKVHYGDEICINTMQTKPVKNENTVDMDHIPDKRANTPVNKKNDLASDISTPMRVFTGSIEKILKWKKLQSSMKPLFEVIAPVVSVREGLTPVEKLLKLRESSGPPLECVFYEIDRPLPVLGVGQLARCVGQMVTDRKLHAVSVREATPQEQASLHRLQFISNRAAMEATLATPEP